VTGSSFTPRIPKEGTLVADTVEYSTPKPAQQVMRRDKDAGRYNEFAALSWGRRMYVRANQKLLIS